MPIPSTIADLSTTASSNSPAGSDPPTEGDNYLRAIQAILKTADNDRIAADASYFGLLGTAATAAAGAGLVGYDASVPYTGGLGQFLNYLHARTAAEIAASVTPTNYAYLPGDVRRYGATGNGSTDDSAAIQAAFDVIIAAGGGLLEFPAGRYVCNSRLKLQNTYTSNIYITLRGAATGNPAVAPANTYGTILVGQTGGILLDLAGGSNITIEDIGFISGSTNPSTIGILCQRIAASQYCTRIHLNRVGIGMTPNAAANGSLGTFGIVNKRGEHHSYKDCWFYADRPYLGDGNSVYATLISPDHAESFPGGATHSLNYFDNCAFLAGAGDCVELHSNFEVRFNGGYMLLTNTYSGLLLGTNNTNISIKGINAELNSGTPKCLVRATGNVTGLSVEATTNIPTLTMLRTVSGATIKGADLRPGIGFTAVFDKTTETGGTMSGALVQYSSANGHTVADQDSIYASILMDGVGGLGSMDVRPVRAPLCINTGDMQPPTTTTGTDSTPVTTETYVAELWVPCTMKLTGATFLQGTVGSGNAKLALANASGAILAQTASFSVAGVTAAYIGNNFTATYLAKGPERYYLLLQIDNTVNRFRTHALGNFGAGKITGGVYGTFATITPPTTFTAGLGPIASVY